jgi:3-oxoacyl-[acyl-carrier protein] reductase
MPDINFDFKGHKFLLTGATGGIGASVTKILIESGATVFGTSTKEEKLEEFSHLYKERFSGKVCDLSDKQCSNQIVAEAKEAMGGLDVVICNAGINKDAISLRMTDENWEAVIATNLTANFIINREAAKHMIKQRSGRIINISSVVGCTGNAGQANYVSSKAGIIGLTKTMALELAGKNITVNAIAPGFIETAMTEAMPTEMKDTVINRIPMRRYGMPSDIAYAVCFLSSQAANYITGTVLHVNGGMFMA